MLLPPPRSTLFPYTTLFRSYGMRGFLILYMTKALGFTDPHAGAVYGNYVGSVWLAAIFGGIIADRWLGHYRSVLIGGIIIALGHFTLAFHAQIGRASCRDRVAVSLAAAACR